MKKVFVLPHLGLGDMFTCNGLFRYLRTKYDIVKIVILKRNLKNAQEIFSDDEGIHFYPIGEDGEISETFGCKREIFEQKTKDYDKIIKIGLHEHGKDICNVLGEIVLNEKFFDMPFSFYKDACVSYNNFWKYFYIPTLKKAEELYNLLYKHKIKKYIFVHNTASTGIVFPTKYVEKKYNINKNETLFINPCITMYDKNDPYYELSKKFTKHSLISYKVIIKNANKIFVTDSSFMCMAINLEIETPECYILSRPYGHGQTCLKKGATHMGLKNAHIWSDKYIFNDEIKRQIFTEVDITKS